MIIGWFVIGVVVGVYVKQTNSRGMAGVQDVYAENLALVAEDLGTLN